MSQPPPEQPPKQPPNGPETGQPIADYIECQRQRIDTWLRTHLDNRPWPAPRLQQAMAYSLLAGGKRIRPILACASAEAVGTLTPAVEAAAAALECIHTYSLIHDDLPAMDDDALRRGEPTCHIAFDEATAILAGDALQTEAFMILSRAPTRSPEARLKMVERLADAAGAAGMVSGQALDMAAAGTGHGDRQPDIAMLEQIHRLKTGALIRASVALGALATEQASGAQLAALDDYARAIGLAFQVQDDILDVVGDTATLGKQQGADAQQDKPTYVSVLGLDQARRHAASLHQQALDALAGFDSRAIRLRQLSEFIVSRHA